MNGEKPKKRVVVAKKREESSLDPQDEQHLRRSIELSRQARAAGNQPFGSVLVGPNGKVIAEDVNTELTSRNIR